jgi:serine protease Do
MSSFMFVFLTGRDKGKTRIYQQDRITIGSSDTCDLVLPVTGVAVTGALVRLPDVIASVKRDDDGLPVLTLQVGDELQFAINGEAYPSIVPGERFPLHDGDTLRFGPPGRGTELLFHLLRQDIYGLHPVPKNPEQSIADLQGNVHPLTATLFVKELTTSLWAEIPVRAKAYLLGGVVAIVTLVGLVVYLNFYQLRTNQEQVRLLQEQLMRDRLEKEEAVRQLQAQQAELDKLGQLYASNRTIAARINEKNSAGVCLIVGVYTFVDRETNRPLRYETVDDANGPVLGETGEMLASPDGLGPVVEVEFTGTGFLVDEGTVVTNRHVVQPWRQDETARVIISQGLRPRVERLLAFFPLHKRPFEVRVTANGDQVDLAVCRIQQGNDAIPILELPDAEAEQPKPGQPIVLLGYPTGVEGLVERLAEGDRAAVVGRGNRTIVEVAQTLADRGAIRPLTTQGIIGDVAPGRIVHNAATTEGGSGGPIFDDAGRVVAVNSAILVSSETGQSFAGSNFAIPISAVRPLLPAAEGKIAE